MEDFNQTFAGFFFLIYIIQREKVMVQLEFVFFCFFCLLDYYFPVRIYSRSYQYKEL